MHVPMSHLLQWHKDPGPRIEGSRSLDQWKVQAPGIVRRPDGGFRLFYTAVGPAKPFASCQGYILSATSDDGLHFEPEPDIRLAPDPGVPHMSHRLLAPNVTQCTGGWRMYVEARGTADRPVVIASAFSPDMINWTFEPGIRLQTPGGVGGPRYVDLKEAGGRLYCVNADYGSAGKLNGPRQSQSVVSAVTHNGLDFELEPGVRLQDKQSEEDDKGITAAEAIAPSGTRGDWFMVYSAWQNVPPGTVVPIHPAQDPNADASGSSENFAAASIAVDLAGYRSRIFAATSPDGLAWQRAGCILEGSGYQGDELDAVHAEDMSMIKLDDDRFRMYYASCDTKGNWRVASATSDRGQDAANGCE